MIITAWVIFYLGSNEFWGATVITNLASTIPVGAKKLLFGYGGLFSRSTNLREVFSLHFLFLLLLPVGYFAFGVSSYAGSNNP